MTTKSIKELEAGKWYIVEEAFGNQYATSSGFAASGDCVREYENNYKKYPGKCYVRQWTKVGWVGGIWLSD